MSRSRAALLPLLQLASGIALVGVAASCVDTSGFVGQQPPQKKDGGGGVVCAADEVFTNGQCAPRVASCEEAAAPVCVHGTCQDSEGVAVCACEAGYTSALCTTCAAGSQDHDMNGTCVPDCGASGLKCMAHGKCDDTKGTAACACVVGYALESGACVWRGGPLDPTFQKMPNAWKLENGVVIDPVATGGTNPGLAKFNQPTLCQTDGTLRQTFAMPAGADAEPFALKISARLACDFCPTDGITILTNKGFSKMPFAGSLTAFSTSRVCLGERAYGGPLELAIQGISNGDTCFETSAALDVDNAVIEPAADCPVPGQIPNADFEGTGSWATSGAGADVSTGVGTGNSRGGHIFTSTLCQGPSLSGTMSAPYTSVPNPAVSFSYKGTNDKDMTVMASDNIVLTAKGTATFQMASMCLPEWSKGVVTPLAFGLPPSSGVCATADVRDFVFDDLKIVSDPTCPSPAYVIDGGFEKETGVSRSWFVKSPPGFSGSGSIDMDPLDAHAGNGSLALWMSSPCLKASASQVITVPDSLGTAGPAVKFWFKAPVITRASFSTNPGTGNLVAAAAYTQKTVCLDPRGAGRALTFTISASGGSGTCADSYSRESAWFDDIQVTTDPSCRPN